MTDANFGKYRLIAEIGHGGMADVFLAVVGASVGLGFEKLVVIKRLRAALADEQDFVTMLLDEGRIAARLNHPNVVQTLEVGEFDNQYFLVMEYLDGQPLHRIHARAAKVGKLSTPMQLRILSEVLAGLHHAHELSDYDGTPLNVIHRDVSPHNVFVTYAGQVKIVDFGIAKATGGSSETKTGVVKGKVTYMSPEQAIGREIDRRADVFSVGVMLWEAVAGVRMWKDTPDISIMRRLIDGEIPTSPRAVNPSVPAALDEICKKALAPDPKNRHATAAELQSELETYLAQTSERAGSRDIGTLVAELFADRRANMKAIIEKQLTSSPSIPRAAPSNRTSMVPASFSLPTVSMNTLSSSPSTLAAPENSVDATRMLRTDAALLRPRRGLPVVLGVTFAVGLAVIAFAAFRGRSTAATPEATAPSANATTAPAKEESTISVQLKVVPSTATVTLDDAPLDAAFSGRFPRDGRDHTIRIEAPGYETTSHVVTFNEDVLLDATLARTGAGGGKVGAKIVPRGRQLPPSRATTSPALPPTPTPTGPPVRPKRTIDQDWPE